MENWKCYTVAERIGVLVVNSMWYLLWILILELMVINKDCLSKVGISQADDYFWWLQNIGCLNENLF